MIAYAPWAEPRLARKPGIQPLDPATWIEGGPDHAAQMAERVRLLAERRDAVHAVTPGSEAAQVELLAMLCAHLGLDVPEGEPPLVAAGRLVQEDFCLLQRAEGEDEYRLTAAILCFPSRWSLAGKIGHPLTHIHGPVPDYTPDLAARVNRLFDGVRAGRPLWRANWTVHSIPDLFQPSGLYREAESGAADLFMRVERQTFLRLPASGAVAFGIRTHVDPLHALTPEQGASLHDALMPLGPEEIAYRGGPALHRAALDALADRKA
jgi:hypothetical protein